MADQAFDGAEAGDGSSGGKSNEHGIDQHHSTPLDLLLNAISGSSTQYPYDTEDTVQDSGLDDDQLNLGGFLGAQEQEVRYDQHPHG